MGVGRVAMAEVAEDVMAVIARKVPGRAGEMKLTDNLQDLGLESIDALEMIFDLEEKFGVQIPYNANQSEQEFATIADVVTMIERLLAEKS
jgi:acyl carrier protein